MAARRKSSRLEKILIISIAVVMVIGMGLLFYPTLSDMLVTQRQAKKINTYEESIEKYSSEGFAVARKEAEAFNEMLRNDPDSEPGLLSASLEDAYHSALNMAGDGMMGFLSIPDLKLKIPIYHGTEESVMQESLGHLEGTTLPIGGDSTHAVISGHNGLTTARLFTGLSKMDIGSEFSVHVLGEELKYVVDQITTVLPDDISDVMITDGSDYVTLVTCTPYGINTHRLLVRGIRTT